MTVPTCNKLNRISYETVPMPACQLDSPLVNHTGRSVFTLEGMIRHLILLATVQSNGWAGRQAAIHNRSASRITILRQI